VVREDRTGQLLLRSGGFSGLQSDWNMGGSDSKMLGEGCEVTKGETQESCGFAFSRAPFQHDFTLNDYPPRDNESQNGIVLGTSEANLKRALLILCWFALSLIFQGITVGTAHGGCSFGGSVHWGGDVMADGSMAFSSIVSMPASSSVSSSRSSAVVARPVVRAGELSLRFYLRYEGGQFWWTLERPTPSCQGLECGTKSNMETAIVFDFQSRLTMTHATAESVGLRAVFNGSEEGLAPRSVKAERGSIEVVEPPPRRYL